MSQTPLNERQKPIYTTRMCQHQLDPFVDMETDTLSIILDDTELYYLLLELPAGFLGLIHRIYT